MRKTGVMLWVGVGLLGDAGCLVYDESLLPSAVDGGAITPADEASVPAPDAGNDADPASDDAAEPSDDAALDQRTSARPDARPEPSPEPEPPEAGPLIDAAAHDASAEATCGASCGATCSDGIMNGTETGIDCGGSCPASNTCGWGSSCTTGLRCQSGYCKNGVCANDTALRFTGAQSFSMPRPVADDFTIELWVKTTQVMSGTLWYDGAWLFQADVTVSSNDFGTSLVNGKFALGTGNPDFNVISSSTINNGQWIHVAASRVKATGMLSVFVNGVLEKAAASSNTGSLTGTATAHVGCTAIPCNHAFIGDLDEIRVWNVARSAAQIASTMKTRLLGTEAGLVGYWRLDEGQGKTFEDSSPTKANGMWTTTDNPVFTLPGAPLAPGP